MIYGPSETRYGLTPNPPNNEVISYTLIFLSAFIILYISYLRSLNPEINNFYHLLNMNLRNLDNERSRNLESFESLQNRYVDKFLNLKCLGALNSITSQNKTYISHKFFRNIEYTVAECLINIAHKASLRRNGDPSIIRYKIRIEEIIKIYTKIYDGNTILKVVEGGVLKQRCILSLLIRIIQNMSYIKNINNRIIINIFEDIFTRRFGVNLHDILEQIPSQCSYNIFENYLNFWEPELLINLKHLTRLNLIILNF